jgi:hypothetical protein
MGLSGDLKTMPLADLLQWSKTGKKTGTIIVSNEGIVKTVYMDDGMLVSAGSNDPKEYLGQFLISTGRLTEEQLQKAFEAQKRTKILLGKILVTSGQVSQEELEKVLEHKIAETIYDLFLWEEGNFRFQEEEFSDKDMRIQVALDVDHCIFEGARRYDEWARIRKIFPNDRIVFALNGPRPKNLQDKPRLKKIFDLIDQMLCIEEIYLEMRGPTFPIVSKLFELFRKKYIKTIGEKKKKAQAEKVSKFQFEEEEILYLYRHYLPPAKIPRLIQTLELMESYKLSSEEAFILSRINNEWDVSTIVMISSIKEVDTLRILKRFLDEKLIDLRDPRVDVKSRKTVNF